MIARHSVSLFCKSETSCDEGQVSLHALTKAEWRCGRRYMISTCLLGNMEGLPEETGVVKVRS
jgi:hypothetical protein